MPKNKLKKTKLDKKLNIYYNIAENSGVGYYRQFLPALALRESGLANVLINDFTWGEVRLFCNRYFPECKHVTFGFDAIIALSEYTKHLKEVHDKVPTDEEIQTYKSSLINMVEPAVETLNRIGHWADIIIVGRQDTSNYLSQWKGIGQFFNIPIVVDTDDNVHATRPFNPGYRGYYPGSEAMMWNRKTIQEMDAVTVSTEHLKLVHQRDNENIYVIPNRVELNRWKIVPREKHDEIRIGLLVSASHHEDVKLLVNVLPIVLSKNSKVHFYYTNMFSYMFEGLEKAFPDRVHRMPWIPLKQWPEMVSQYGFDIGLAPLVDNMFNRAKSNLRYLEYSSAGMAVVASPVEPYKMIIDGETGLLASTPKEWVNAIDYLIKNKDSRDNLVKNAQKMIKEKFDVYNSSSLYLKVYKEIIKKFHQKRGQRKFELQEKAFAYKQPEKALHISALV